jgi:hypothetical protein
MSTLVHNYVCKVLDGLDAIDDTIQKAHKYYNKLVELDRARREAYDKARREQFPAYDKAQTDVEEWELKVKDLQGEIKRANARAKRKRATKAEIEALKAAKASRKDAWAKRKEQRDLVAADVPFQAYAKKLDEEYNGVIKGDSKYRSGGKLKEARANCQVYWGTYLKIEGAIEAAKKDSTAPLGFRHWTGRGLVGIQIRDGCTYGEVVSGSGTAAGLINQVSVSVRGRSRCRHVTFRLRAGTDDQGRATYCTVRATWTREMPEDARIVGVVLARRPMPPIRKRTGWEPQYRWSLQFTLHTGVSKVKATDGECGIDLGWRMMEDGRMRVAYLVDSKGHQEEFSLPARLVTRWEKSESLQSIRDLNFNQAIAELLAWKDDMKAGAPEWKDRMTDEEIAAWRVAAKDSKLPEWFHEMSRYMAMWRSHVKLIRLIERMEKEPIVGGADILQRMLDWRAQEGHLLQFEVFNRLQGENRRLQLFRIFVSDIRKRYATIGVEDCDWTTLARKPKVEDNKFDPSKRNMKIASIGKLRELFIQAGAKAYESEDTTAKCHRCGSLEEWDQAKELWHTCSQCSTPWDQDYNAAANLLKMAQEAKAAARTAPTADGGEPAKKYVGRWAKLRAERLAKANAPVEGQPSSEQTKVPDEPAA